MKPLKGKIIPSPTTVTLKSSKNAPLLSSYLLDNTKMSAGALSQTKTNHTGDFFFFFAFLLCCPVELMCHYSLITHSLRAGTAAVLLLRYSPNIQDKFQVSRLTRYVAETEQAD